jgi:hypothetical protein
MKKPLRSSAVAVILALTLPVSSVIAQTSVDSFQLVLKSSEAVEAHVFYRDPKQSSGPPMEKSKSFATNGGYNEVEFDGPSSLDQDIYIIVKYSPLNGQNREYGFRVSRRDHNQPIELSFDWYSPVANLGAANEIDEHSDDIFQRYISARVVGSRLMRQVANGGTELGRTIAEIVDSWFQSYTKLSSANEDNLPNVLIPYDKELYLTLRCFQSKGEVKFLEKYVFEGSLDPALSTFYKKTDSVSGIGPPNWWNPPCKKI